MFQNLKIGSRLVFLIVVQIAILAAIGGIAFFGLNQTSDASRQLSNAVGFSNQLSQLNQTLQTGLIGTVNQVNTGATIWGEGRERLASARESFENDWRNYLEIAGSDESITPEESLEPRIEGVRTAFTEAEGLFEQEDRATLSLFVLNDFNDLVGPFLSASLTAGAQERSAAEAVSVETAESSTRFITLSGLLVAGGIILSGLFGMLVYRSISRPIDSIAETVNEVNSGNYQVRTEMAGDDELSQLGTALDSLLDQRVTSLVNTERDNSDLNNSVLQLLDAVSSLSERDLTVQVPVQQDVTGPVADAINQMAEETGQVLKGVLDIAQQVQVAANSVNENASNVTSVAENQQTEVERAAQELAEAADSLNEIARVATECNVTADQTARSTQNAVESVTTTLHGMNEIREGVQETGKRMKRLGERSNEITSIVDIINTIAERTHVLALNASMQAASAGEAGRGFAVVAEEVQRLAENARESTAQISKLIRNIQVDTTDTIATMDRTISQVVEGTRLAESAGQQMTATQEATSRLVAEVQRIAEGSKTQARISGQLQERANGIVARTQQTAQELMQQLSQTSKMVDYSKELLRSVNLFRLPE